MIPHPADDAQLLLAWHASHDGDAFRALCERHAGLVEAVCRRQGSPDPAEAVQAVFLILARRAASVSGANLCGWLTVTATRVVLNQRRAVASRRHHEQEAAVELHRQRSDDGDPVWADARPHLDAALSSLSPGRREAVLRFYLAGKPQSVVAAELGCSVDAVKTRVHEGLAGLRDFFARRGLAFGTAVLASCLATEAAAGEPGLSSACMNTVLNPASAPGAQALAHQVLTSMFIKTSILLASGILVAASCLMAVLLPAAEPLPPRAVPAPVDPFTAQVAPVTAAERQELAQGNNQLACDLLARIAEKDAGNLCFSPFSMRAALAMAYAGAKGATAAQMRQALRLGPDDERTHAAMGAAIADLNAGGTSGPEVAVANSLWVDRSGSLLPSFLQLTQRCYGAGLELVDFTHAAEEQRARINGWVAERTKQRILDLIPPGGVTTASRMVLVNAVYFKGAWAQRFDPAMTTQERWDRSDKRIQLMQRQAEYRYAYQRMVDRPSFVSGRENGLVHILELPYVGGTASMLVLLPSINTAMSDLVRELSEAKLTAAIAALRPQAVQVALPRFSLAWGVTDVGPKQLAILPGLGMQDAFASPQADFSGIDGTHELYLDAVFHKSVVNVHEEGTEAVASTAVVVKVRSPMPHADVVFRADRPFLFLIREHASGAILFLGRMSAPE